MSEEFMTATEVAQFHAEGLRMRTEAEVLRKRTAEDRAAADYALGQAEHRLKTVQATEAGISARETQARRSSKSRRSLEREKAADAKLAEAKAVMAQYSADKHGAARALIAINEREAARGKAA